MLALQPEATGKDKEGTSSVSPNFKLCTKKDPLFKGVRLPMDQSRYVSVCILQLCGDGKLDKWMQFRKSQSEPRQQRLCWVSPLVPQCEAVLLGSFDIIFTLGGSRIDQNSLVSYQTNTQVKNNNNGWLEALATLAVQVLRGIHIRCFTTVHNSSSWYSPALFWQPRILHPPAQNQAQTLISRTSFYKG